ncbi:MAG: type VI secretion system baseplate subunit TssG [Algicola sp.]|nr:type VI secretion system baseplate subunit TssG [Algicola sp.]
MADIKAQSNSVVEDELFNSARKFNFIKAVELLSKSVGVTMDIGYLAPAKHEKILFRANPTMGFPSADIDSCTKITTGDKQLIELQVNFMGLYGPSSPLPAYFTESIINVALNVEDEGAVVNEDGQLSRGSSPADRQRDFLDVFNHRLISLFYRAATKYQPFRAYQAGSKDQFSQKIFSIMGAPDARQREKSALNWSRLLHFTGLMGLRNATKERIIKILSGYFDLPRVEVEEGVLRLVNIPKTQQVALGQRNAQMGEDFMLGSTIPDRSGKFRVILSQLNKQQFILFLPTLIDEKESSKVGAEYQAMNELLQFIKPRELVYDIKLELSAGEAPPFELEPESICRLGLSTWLGDTSGQCKSVIIDI